MGLHKNAQLEDIHTPHAFEYTDSLARESATGFTDSDIKKLSLQTDDNTLWMLVGINPTQWKGVGGNGELNTNGIYLSSGTYNQPTITDNGDGSVTIGPGEYTLYSTSDYRNTPVKYVISGDTFTFADDIINYIVADYNAGSPIIRKTNLLSEINDSSVIPIFTIYNYNSELNIIQWDEQGAGLANKLMRRFRDTQRFAIGEGLIPTEGDTNSLLISAGYVWYGATNSELENFDSTIDTLYQYNHVDGVWNYSVVTDFNTTQYDDGTNTLSLGSNKFTTRCIYRGAEVQENRAYIILGNQYGSFAEAAASEMIVPPGVVNSHAVLVGRIIYQEGQATASSIDSVSTYSCISTPVTSHSDLSNILGTGQQHISESNLLDISNTTTGRKIPSGTTAQRPTTPITPYIRFNNVLELFEYYNPITGIWENKYSIGDGTNQTNFDSDGTMQAEGTATCYKDQLGALLAGNLNSPSAAIVYNGDEGTVDFKISSDLTEYINIMSQLNHDRVLGSTIYPHIHWIQTTADRPNWLLQYRYQRNGGLKDDTWKYLLPDNDAFTWVSGELIQITGFEDIISPAEDGVSDIVQLRLIRDYDNDSGLFAGTDPVNATQSVLYADLHIEVDMLGSREEYVK